MKESVEKDEITAWLRTNMVPITQLTASKETDDLIPLKKILDGVRIVGLGEATHGTREFFQIRRRLLQFLVVEMGFNTLAIEGSYSAAQSINDHILGGEGDRESILTGLGSVMWDVQEFSEVLDWLRTYNRSVCDAKRVRFCGVDIWNTRVGREKVLAYLRAVAPEKVLSIAELFHQMALGEARGMAVAHEHIDKELFLRLQSLADLFAISRDAFVSQTSMDEYQQIIRNVEVMLQWVGANMTDEWPFNFARSRCMAENIIHIVERDEPQAKVVIWGHNYHLAIGFKDPIHGAMPNMGHCLRERYGERYYVFGLELNHGTYLARTWLSDNTPGNHLAVVTIPCAPEGSLPWYLSRTHKPAFLLDLRGPAPPQLIAQWLMTPRVVHCIGWSYVDPPEFYTEMAIKRGYDGIIFVASTSATTPTKNASRVVSEGASH